MEFRNKLSVSLRQKDFSPEQLKRLQEAFGDLDAAGLLTLPSDQLFSIITGRKDGLERAKIIGPVSSNWRMS